MLYTGVRYSLYLRIGMWPPYWLSLPSTRSITPLVRAVFDRVIALFGWVTCQVILRSVVTVIDGVSGALGDGSLFYGKLFVAFAL